MEEKAKAMVFEGEKLKSTFRQARKFAGRDGKLATLIDVVEARLRENDRGSVAWRPHLTGLTALYKGVDKNGKKILMVVHGIGPLSTLEGIHKVYNLELEVSQDDFLALAEGKYGQVKIIDLEAYTRFAKEQYIPSYPNGPWVLTESQALTDPLLKALFGPRAEEYIRKQAQVTRHFHLEEEKELFVYNPKLHKKLGADNSDPHVFELNLNSLYCDEKQTVSAQLIQLGNMIFRDGGSYKDHITGFVRDIYDMHSNRFWSFIGIQPGWSAGIAEGPDLDKLTSLSNYMKPVVKFCPIMKLGATWFTQRSRTGEGKDNLWPEFMIKNLTRVGEPIDFKSKKTDAMSQDPLYDPADIKRIVSSDANVYEIIEATYNPIDGSYSCRVQPYKAEIDTSRRFMGREKAIKIIEAKK